MFDFEIAVEFGFNFKYFIVKAETAKDAKQKVWETLDEDLKNQVSSIEVTDVVKLDDTI